MNTPNVPRDVPRYEVVRETPTSNRIVKELNAAVLTATFTGNGWQLADLYSNRNSADCLVAHNTCPPIHGQFVQTVLINLVK